ncbi:MAG: hypothetical protein LBQ79_14490 [Deltaproteobacteria bacterium]|nr:hypothetical protein [Deltaproteobacteria bacterium]
MSGREADGREEGSFRDAWVSAGACAVREGPGAVFPRGARERRGSAVRPLMGAHGWEDAALRGRES